MGIIVSKGWEDMAIWISIYNTMSKRVYCIEGQLGDPSYYWHYIYSPLIIRKNLVFLLGGAS